LKQLCHQYPKLIETQLSAGNLANKASTNVIFTKSLRHLSQSKIATRMTAQSE
jgi:hypothetical protein